MLVGVLFLVVVLAVAVLIAVDVVRTPHEAPIGPGERHAHDGDRILAGARSGDRIKAFSPEPAVREQSVPAATAEARIGAGPAAFERADQAARAFDPPRRSDMPPPPPGDAAAHGRSHATWVNLSRRSQALVERQLRLIENLEHGEQDPQRLASLSGLNRIALRVHRNSENLLVLAGQDQPMGWNQPVTLAHLIEAALAEVEDYQRVSFEVQPDIAVRGPAVHDTVHLLVELIDNATSFSAGDMPVHIKGPGSGHRRRVGRHHRPGHRHGRRRRWRTRTSSWTIRRRRISISPSGSACSWSPGWPPGTGSGSG